MEELQDAIEDVQYLQAVNSKDSGPSPTEAWPFPSEKELEAFNTARLKENGQSFSLERICGGVLGLYLVRASAQPDLNDHLLPVSRRMLCLCPCFSLLFVLCSAVWYVLHGDGRAQQIRVHVGCDTISGERLAVGRSCGCSR